MREEGEEEEEGQRIVGGCRGVVVSMSVSFSSVLYLRRRWGSQKVQGIANQQSRLERRIFISNTSFMKMRARRQWTRLARASGL